MLEQIELPEQSIVWDRTHEVELARFGEFNREVVTFDEIPPVLVDATTAIEDALVLGQRGLRPHRHRRRGHRRDPRAAARRLHDHPAARPPAPAHRRRRGADRGHREPQDQGDHPVDPRDPGLPGRGGQAADHRRLPQPELLRQRVLRRRGGRRHVLRQGAVRADPRGGRDHRRAAAGARRPTTSSRTPSRSASSRARRRTPARSPSSSSPTTRRSSSAGTSCWTRWRRAARRSRRTSSRTPTSRRPRPRRWSSRPQVKPQWKASHFVWQVRRELTARLCPEDTETCPILERGGLDITSTLDWRLQEIAEKWVKAAVVVPHAKNPEARAKALGLDYEPWMRNLRTKDLRNGALVAMDYQTGELVAYVGSANATATKATKKFQPRFDVIADGWRQPGSAFKPIVYGSGIDARHDHGGVDVHGRRDRLRRRRPAHGRGQPRARAGPHPQRAPVLAQHPRGQGGRGHRQRHDPGDRRVDGDPVPQRRGRRGHLVPAGRRGGPAARPHPRLWRAGRRGQARGPDDDHHGRHHERRAAARPRRTVPRRSRSWTRVPRSS